MLEQLVRILARNPLLLLFLVAAIGYPLGQVRLRGSQIGVAAVLFVGSRRARSTPRSRSPRSSTCSGSRSSSTWWGSPRDARHDLEPPVQRGRGAPPDRPHPLPRRHRHARGLRVSRDVRVGERPGSTRSPPSSGGRSRRHGTRSRTWATRRCTPPRRSPSCCSSSCSWRSADPPVRLPRARTLAPRVLGAVAGGAGRAGGCSGRSGAARSLQSLTGERCRTSSGTPSA